MNIRNIFRRSSTESTSSSAELTESAETQTLPQPASEVDENPINMQHVADGASNDKIWFERDNSFINDEISFMAESYPDFSLSILDDTESTLNGSLCWHGIIKPQIMEDMEWEITLVYQGIGGGKGDWSGIMTIYLSEPPIEQVIETLGYTPGCFCKDADGAYTLANDCIGGVKSAMKKANRFCWTVEKMCKGEIREDYLTGDILPSSMPDIRY